jgi:hypothetical protein
MAAIDQYKLKCRCGVVVEVSRRTVIAGVGFDPRIEAPGTSTMVTAQGSPAGE